MFRLWIAPLLLLLAACSSSDSRTESAVRTIADLKAMCSGRVCHIVEDISIVGTVVANDWLGEYHKSFVLFDGSHGIEVAFEERDIAAILPINSRVTIYCNGLALGRLGDKVVLGAVPTGDYPVDNIAAQMFSRYIRVESLGCEFSYAERRLDNISIADMTLPVVVRNVSLDNTLLDMRWCDRDEEGNLATTTRTLVDDGGNTLPLRTLGTCDYADEAVPTGKFTLCGVVDYVDGGIGLRIVNHSIY